MHIKWSVRDDVGFIELWHDGVPQTFGEPCAGQTRCIVRGEALVADVPVGAYLSGGVDSSLITALVAQQRQGAGLHTFSAGFGDDRLDETSWARQVAGIVGSTHHEVLVTADDFQQNWSKLSWHRDAPLSEPADVAVFRLAQLARQEVKVVLSGEGSDELFGGYPKYLFANATRWAGVIPGSVLRHVEKSLPASKSRLGIAMRAVSEPSHAERMRGWFAPFTVSERTDRSWRCDESGSARSGFDSLNLHKINCQ